MAIDYGRSLRHMAWANEQVYSAVAALPDEALGAYLVNPEWTAGTILQHIVSGADWYAYCLTAQMWQEVPIPQRMAEVAQLAATLAELDDVIVAQARQDEAILSIQMEDGVFDHHRSMLLAQAVHHAAEHRAQLIDALEFRGYKAINLDDIDLWAFEKVDQ